MRRSSPLLLAVALLASCGDDGKTGPKSPPPEASSPAGTAAPAPAVPSPPPPPATEAPSPPREPTGWAGTRAGDWATWEIRAAGSAALTRVTWRARSVDAGRVALAIESRTAAADGSVLSSASSEEVHDAALDRPSDPAAGRATKSADVTVSGARLETFVHPRRTPAGEVLVWTSASVPFSGVVRASGGGLEQSLVAFGRGR